MAEPAQRHPARRRCGPRRRARRGRAVVVGARQVRTVTSVPDTPATTSAPRVAPLPTTTTPTTTTSPATTVVMSAATVAEQVGVALSRFESFSATTTQTRYDEEVAGVRSN